MTTDKKVIEHYKERVCHEILPKTSQVKIKASGILKYDYLIPSGPYNQQWDWDAFFMGLALMSWVPSEAIYLKNITMNILEFSDENGKCPGCLRPEGPSKTLVQTKPFTAQGAYLAGYTLKDFSWIKPYYSRLLNIVLYREKNYWHKEYCMASWWDSMESGADNNVAMLNYPNNSVIAPDLNTFLYLEYKAFSLISYELEEYEQAEIFKRKSEQMKVNIVKYLWCDEDDAIYVVDTANGEFIKRMSYSSVVPLWAGLLPHDKASKFIEKYVLNPNKLWSDYGIRSLSKDDADYNNVNMIKPFSNWQGPVWPLANYLYCHGLSYYGYKDKAIEAAILVIKNCLKDIEQTGGMHENYDAETGEPLAAPDFVSWNILLINLLQEIEDNRHPLSMLL